MIQAFAWSLAVFLMIYEYRRLLSEALYANQLFWILNLIAELVTIGILRKEIYNSIFMMCTASVNLIVNLSLLIMMFKTEKRTVRNRRPNIEDIYLKNNYPEQYLIQS